MRLRYETKRNPIMSAVLVAICLCAFGYILLKVDLTRLVFGRIGVQVQSMKTMSAEQYAEVVALAKQQFSNNQNATAGPDKQLTTTVSETAEQRNTTNLAHEAGTVYQYVDSAGMIVMVDDLNKVPAKYRAKMKTSAGMYGQQRTVVKVQNNQIWVPVALGHKGRTVTALLLLDTGATNTSISPALARRLGIQSTETTSGKARLADGSSVRTAHVIVDSVSVGPKLKRNLDVQIMPRSGDEETGLLGFNFLGEFPHIIEAKAGIIRWQ